MFHTTLNYPHKVFATVAAAHAVADPLNADPEDDWTFVVVPDPLGSSRAIIAIYDDGNEFVGNL